MRVTCQHHNVRMLTSPPVLKFEKVGYACHPASADAGWQARYAAFPRPHYVSRYDFDIFQQVSYLDIEIPDVFEIPLLWL